MQPFFLRIARDMCANCGRWLGAGAVLFALMACSCSRPATPPSVESRVSTESGPNPFLTAPDLTTQPGTVFDVKYSPNTLRIEPNKFIHSLRSISPDHSIYIFDKSSEVARALQPGKIMFVPGLTLQKVIATVEDGQDLIVGAGEAPLTEAIENGTIQWDHPVSFQQVAEQQRRAAIPRPEKNGLLAGLDGLTSRLVPTVWAAPKVTEEQDSSSGEESNWEQSTQAQPDSSGLNFKHHLEKKANAAGINVAIDISGHVQNFRNSTSILIHDSKLDSFNFHNSGMNIEGNVVWTVSKQEPGVATGEEDIRLPTSFSVPLIIGGLPFSLELSEALMFKPGFTSKGDLAKGGFKFQMNGDNGFKWGGADAADDSNSSGESSIEDHGGLAPVAPFAVLIAVTAPRIELSTGPDAAFQQLKRLALVPQTLKDRLAVSIGLLSKSNAFAQWLQQQAGEVLKAKGAAHVQLIVSTSATIGGAAALIPCQRTQLVLTGNAGVSASFFKLLKKEYEVNFFRQEKVITLPPGKACQI